MVNPNSSMDEPAGDWGVMAMIDRSYAPDQALRLDRHFGLPRAHAPLLCGANMSSPPLSGTSDSSETVEYIVRDNGKPGEVVGMGFSIPSGSHLVGRGFDLKPVYGFTWKDCDH